MVEESPVVEGSEKVSPLRRYGDVGAVFDAMSKAQNLMDGAKKDSANPFFKSKYADLESVAAACMAQLNAVGIAVVQAPSAAGGMVSVTTILGHKLGSLESTLTLVAVKADPQGIGSAITYARRYGLAAMAGVAPEDDDAEAAHGRTHQAPAPASLEDKLKASVDHYKQKNGNGTNDAAKHLAEQAELLGGKVVDDFAMPFASKDGHWEKGAPLSSLKTDHLQGLGRWKAAKQDLKDAVAAELARRA